MNHYESLHEQKLSDLIGVREYSRKVLACGNLEECEAKEHSKNECDYTQKINDLINHMNFCRKQGYYD